MHPTSLPPERRALLQIHLCVLLWAFTAILGKLIRMPASQLVAWRLLLVVGLLALLPRAWRAVRGFPVALTWRYAGIGAIVALHWLAFYGSIKLANASVATICLALAPVTIVLLEPLLHGAPLRRRELALGLVVIPGIAMIVGGIPSAMTAGFWMGVASALLTATYTVLNKRWIGDRDALGVTAVELAGGLLVVLVLLPLLPDAAPRAGDAAWADVLGVLAIPSARDFGLLFLLASACTLLPFALSLAALRHVSAFTLQLSVNLEPIYAIALAAAFLGEARELGALFYVGAALVIAAVLAHGLSVAGYSSLRRSMPGGPSPDPP